MFPADRYQEGVLPCQLERTAGRSRSAGVSPAARRWPNSASARRPRTGPALAGSMGNACRPDLLGRSRHPMRRQGAGHICAKSAELHAMRVLPNGQAGTGIAVHAPARQLKQRAHAWRRLPRFAVRPPEYVTPGLSAFVLDATGKSSLWSRPRLSSRTSHLARR